MNQQKTYLWQSSQESKWFSLLTWNRTTTAGVRGSIQLKVKRKQNKIIICIMMSKRGERCSKKKGTYNNSHHQSQVTQGCKPLGNKSSDDDENPIPSFFLSFYSFLPSLIILHNKLWKKRRKRIRKEIRERDMDVLCGLPNITQLTSCKFMEERNNRRERKKRMIISTTRW